MGAEEKMASSWRRRTSGERTSTFATNPPSISTHQRTPSSAGSSVSVAHYEDPSRVPRSFQFHAVAEAILQRLAGAGWYRVRAEVEVHEVVEVRRLGQGAGAGFADGVVVEVEVGQPPQPGCAE